MVFNMNKLINIQLSEDENAVIILDQRLLPSKTEYLRLSTADEMYDAIKYLKIRGAPAIGIFAAYAMYVLSKSPQRTLSEYGDYLKSSRPTAVNLQWAVERMLKAENLREECHAIHREDIAMCKAISENGLSLIKDGEAVLTHCNAGPLATSQYGTGLGPLILGSERGMHFKAYVDETRPLLQGARITALELMNAGVDVTLICDNMAGEVMKAGKVNAVFTGCDRVAANGDTANKIGTCGVAVLAKHYRVPFYVFCPSSTIDSSCSSGADIVIEERDTSEIIDLYFKEPVAPLGVKCCNPSFDVTPAELITAIVTEKGIINPARLL
ncbi:MAG: S-methyl-5-thioribose-1-phosphate isomerase [Oscillospiraceae bacterium]|nr:S-methyl-5-thioribose-1-phosphate isomerase [Oscillospiraceae bacterium]